MKNFKAYTLSISVLPLLALLLFAPNHPDSSFSEEGILLDSAPCTDDIVAVNSSGPNTCFVRGTFVDFHDEFGPSNVTGASFEWESNLPGFNTNTGSSLLRTYFIPSTQSPGCYWVKVKDLNGVCSGIRRISIRVLASASDPCDECL